MIVFLNGAFGVGKTVTARAMPLAIAAFQDEQYGVEIRTDGRTPAEVGLSILQAL